MNINISSPSPDVEDEFSVVELTPSCTVESELTSGFVSDSGFFSFGSETALLLGSTDVSVDSELSSCFTSDSDFFSIDSDTVLLSGSTEVSVDSELTSCFFSTSSETALLFASTGALSIFGDENFTIKNQKLYYFSVNAVSIGICVEDYYSTLLILIINSL